MKTTALVLSGYGLNCELETKHAFEVVGVKSKIIHVNKLVSNKKLLDKNNILVFPGGFSFGDDLGSGLAYANKIKNNLMKELIAFVEEEKLVLGVCNGFQVLANIGLLPGLNKEYGKISVALQHNDSARFLDRWVDLEIESKKSPWLKNLKKLILPIAHGEGKFFAEPKTLKKLNEKKLIAVKYVIGEISENQKLPFNPNGSIQNIAGITNETGNVLGLMPHPERAIYTTQLPNWIRLKKTKKTIPKYTNTIKIFENAKKYFE